MYKPFRVGWSLALLLSIAAVSAAELKRATVTQTFNDVKVVEPQKADQPASSGAVISGQRGVRTGTQSRAELEFQDRTLTRLGANTIFSFEGGTRAMEMQQGTMLLQVPKDAGGARIRTAAVTAAITGTTILLEYTPDREVIEGGVKKKKKGKIKVIVLEGTLRLSLNNGSNQTVTLTGGQMLVTDPSAVSLPGAASEVDLQRLTQSSLLANNAFWGQEAALAAGQPRTQAEAAARAGAGTTQGRLSMDLINVEIARQQAALAAGTLTPARPDLTPLGNEVMLIGLTDILSQLNVRSEAGSGLESEPVSDKFGPLPPVTPGEFVIDATTIAELDPLITTGTASVPGRIYRGNAADGSPAQYAFGSPASAFDTAFGLGSETFFAPVTFPTPGVTFFKFDTLRLAGTPTFVIHDGPTALALVAVNGLSTAATGSIDFSSLSSVFLTTQNGAINLAAGFALTGGSGDRLAVYARGGSSDLVSAAQVTGFADVRLAAEHNLQVSGGRVAAGTRAELLAGGNLTFAGQLAAPTVVLTAQSGMLSLNPTGLDTAIILDLTATAPTIQLTGNLNAGSTASTLRFNAGAGGFNAGTFTLTGTARQISVTVSGTGGFTAGSFFGNALTVGGGAINVGGALNVNTLTFFGPINAGSITANTINANSGTIGANLSAGTVNVGGSLTLTGGGNASFNLGAGATLNLNNGTNTLNAASISGSGNVFFITGTNHIGFYGTTGQTIITGGTVSIDQDANFRSLILLGGTLAGTGNFRAAGMSWTGGNIAGSGSIDAINFSITGVTPKFLSRNFNASGGGRINGADLTFSGGITFSLQDAFVIETANILGDASNTFAIGGTRGELIVRNLSIRTTISVRVQNSGIVRVESGALALTGGGGGGSWSAQAGAALEFTAGTFAGGLGISGGGTVRFNGANVDAGAFDSLGAVEVSAGALTLNSASSAQDFTLSGGTLGGTGHLTVAGFLIWTGGAMTGAGLTDSTSVLGLSGAGTKSLVGLRTLVAGGISTMSGGNLDFSGNAQLFNSGVFSVTDSASFTGTSTDGIVNTSGAFFVKSGTGTTTNVSVPFANLGTVRVDGGTLNFTNSYVQSSGTTTLLGGSLATASALQINAGLLDGSGAITGNVISSAAIMPSIGAGSTGLAISGNLSLLTGSTLNFTLGGLTQGSGYGFLSTGSASLGGTLVLTFANGFGASVANTDTFTLLTSSTPLVGLFTNVGSIGRLVTADGLGSFAVDYTGNALILSNFLPAGSTLDAVFLGGTNVWSNAASWSTNPLVPNNGSGLNYNAIVNSGTLDQDIAAGVTIQRLTMTGGVLSLSHPLTLNAGLTYSGGSLTGGTLTLPVGSTSTQSATMDAAGLTIDHAGTFTVSGFDNASTLNGSAIFNNTGTLNLNAPTLLVYTAVLNNTGLVNLTGGATLLGAGGVSTGTFDLATGATLVTASAATFNDGTIFRGGGEVILADGNPTTFSGTIQNQITLRFDPNRFASPSAFAHLNVAGDTTLTGPGAVILTDDSRIGGTGTLTLAGGSLTGFTTGLGSVGQDQIGLVIGTGALIDANVAGQTLKLDAGAAGVVNQGTLMASGNGFLQLSGAGVGQIIDNSGGQIVALSGSQVRLSDGVVLFGGTLTGGGSFSVLNSATLHDLSISGIAVFGANGSATTLIGTINNAGGLVFNSGGVATDIVLSGDVLLAGGGNFQIGSNARVRGAVGGEILINENFIRGESSLGGSLGSDNIGIVNNGSIRAATANRFLLVDPNAAHGLINNGVMEGDAQGLLRLTGNGGGDFVNTTGIIQAMNQSEVQFTQGARIIGGSLNAFGTGRLRVLDSATFENVSFGPGVPLLLDNGSTTTLVGSIENGGAFTLASISALTELLIDGTVTLTGGGTITLANASRVRAFASGAVLVNVDNLIQGSSSAGSIGNGDVDLVNQAAGAIDANVAGAFLTVHSGPGGLSNAGTLRASGGGTLSLTGGPVANAGTVQVNPASTVQVDAAFTNSGAVNVGSGNFTVGSTGSFTQSAGTFAIAGGTVTSTASLIFNGGTLGGYGTFNAPVTNAATIQPAIGAGSTGLAFGSLLLQGTSRLEFTLGGLVQGSGYSFISASGNVTMGGQIVVSFANGFQGSVSAGDTFTLLTAGTLSGAFATPFPGGRIFTADGAGSFLISTSGNQIVLTGFATAAILNATYLGGTNNWSTAAGWTTNPNVPNNGVGGNTYNATINGGTVTQDIVAGVTVQQLNLGGGTLALAQPLAANALVTWSGGLLNGSSTLTLGGGLTLAGAGFKDLSGTVMLLNLAGSTATDGAGTTGALRLGGNVVFRNEGAFLAQNNLGIASGGGTPTFENIGTFTRDTATGNYAIGVTFNNSGTLSVNTGTLTLTGGGGQSGTINLGGAGTLAINGGSTLFSTGASVNGGGNLIVSNGTVIVANPLTFNAGLFRQTGGTLSIAGTLTQNGEFEFGGGILTGSAPLVVTGGITFSGAGFKELQGGTLINAAGSAAVDGTASTGALRLTLAGTLFQNDGTFFARNNLGIATGGGSPSIVNNGVFTRDVAAGIYAIGPVFDNAGTVNGNSGTLRFDGGGTHSGSFVAGAGGTINFAGGPTTFLGGASTSGAGTIQFGGAAVTMSSNLTFGSALLRLTGGTLTLGSGVTFTQNGVFEFGGSQILGNGFVVANGGLSFSGAAFKDLQGGTLVNAVGATATDGAASTGALRLTGASTTFQNDGTFLAQNSLGIASGGGTPRVVNNGTFTRDTAAGTYAVAPNFINTGSVNANSGVLSFNGGFTQTGGSTTLNGGNLAGATLNFGNGGLLTGFGAINAAVQNAGIIRPAIGVGSTGFAVTGNVTLLTASELNFQLGGLTQGAQYGRLGVTGTLALGGNLVLSFANGFQGSVTGADTFTLLTSTGAMSGSFVNIANGGRLATTDGFGSFLVSYGGGSLTLSNFIASGAPLPASWTGTTGNWSTAGNWTSNPNFPNNGQPGPGDLYDATVSTGSITLDVPITIQNFTFTNGTIDGANSLTVVQTATWSGGSFSGVGGVTNLQGAFLLNGVGKNLGERTLNIAGAATWSAGALNTGQGAVINVLASGSFDVAFDGSFVFNLGGTRTVLSNAGLLTKSSGVGAATIGAVLSNTGTVRADSGILEFQGGGTNAGAMQITSGATLRVSAGTMDLNAGSVSGAGTFEVTSSGIVNLNGGSYSLGGVTLLTGGTLNVGSAASTVSLSLNSGTLGGSGTLTVADLSSWGGGVMTDAGTTTFNGDLVISGGVGRTLAFRTLNLGGATTWSGGGFSLGQGSVINLLPGANFDTNFGGTMTFNQGGAQTNFNLAAGSTFTRSGGGAASTVIGVIFNNAGAVAVDTGTLELNAGGTSSGSFTAGTGAILRFAGGTHNLGTGSSTTGAGTVQISTGDLNFNAGTFNVAGATIVDGGDLTLNAAASTGAFTLSSGSLAGAAPLSVSGAAVWSGGAFTGTGTVNFNGPLAIDGTTKSLGSATLNLGGATTWTAGGWNTGLGATLNVLGGATFVTDFDGILSFNLGGPQLTFNNAGTLTKSAGAGTTQINALFNNTGAVAANAGELEFAGGGASSGSFTVASGATLRFANGTHTLNTTSSVTGAGTLEIGSTGVLSFNAGTLALSGTLLVPTGTLILNSAASTNVLTLSGGTVTGPGTFSVTGASTWTSGTFSGGGTTNFSSALTIGGLPNKTLNGRTLNLSGSTSWTGGGLSTGNGAVLNILSGATFDTNFDGIVSFNLGGAQMVIGNAGTFTKSGGAGATTLAATFNNAGTASVTSGVLEFAGGGTSTGSFNAGTGAVLRFAAGNHFLNAGSNVGGLGTVEISGTGILLFSAGTFSLGGQLLINGGTLGVAAPASTNVFTMTAGVLGNVGTLTVGGASSWSAGTMTGAGTTRFNNALLIGTAAQHTLTGGRSLQLAGATTWSAGSIAWGQGASILNLASGTLDASFDGSISFNQGGATPSFNNSGTFTKSGGAGITAVSGNFTNIGNVNANSGTIAFTGLFTQTAGTTTLAGGGLSGTAALNFAGGLLTGVGSIGAGVDLGGMLRPGLGGAGLAVNGALTLLGGSQIQFQLGGLTQGSQYGFVGVNGAVALGGQLLVSFHNGFESLVTGANTFTLLTTTSLNFSGAFANIASGGRLNTTDGFGSFLVTYSGNAVVLSNFLPPSAPTAIWDGGSANWSSAGNWSTNPVVPNGNFNAVINSGAVTLDNNFAIEAFTFGGGTLGGPNTLTVNQLFTWSGGTLNGGGTFFANGGLDLTGAADRSLDNAAFVVPAGRVATDAGGHNFFLANTASIGNLGTWNATGAGGLTSGGGGSNVFNNSGTFNRTGAGLYVIGVPFNNTGAVDVATGQLRLSGGGGGNGTYNVGTGSELQIFNNYALGTGGVSGSGLLRLGANATLNVPATVPFGSVMLTLEGSATLSVAAGQTLVLGGAFSFNAGTLAGGGTIRLTAGGTLGSDTLVTLNSTRLENAAGSNLVHGAGAVGSFVLTNAAVFANAGSFFAQNDLGLTSGGGAPAVNNTGSFTRNTGTGIYTVAQTFNNSGTVAANSGTLRFTQTYTQTAGTTIVAGGALSTTGFFDIQGGLFTGYGNVTGTLSSAGVLRPAIGGTDRLNITGGLLLQAGGQVQMQLGGLVQGTQYSSIAVSGGTTLNGNLLLSFANGFEAAVSNGDTFTLLTTGTNFIGNFANATNGTRLATTDGFGTFLVSVTSNTVSLSNFLSSSTNIWTGTTGTWSAPANWSAGVPNGATTDVAIDGGRSGVGSVVNVNGAFAIRDLTVDGGDQLVVLNGNALTLNGLLRNSGIVTIQGGATTTLGFTNPTTITGAGTITLAANGATLSSSGGLTNAAGHTIQGTGAIVGPFVNQGFVRANGGTLTFNNGFIQDGALGLLVLQGGTLSSPGVVTVNAGTVAGFGTISGGLDTAATVAVAGGTLNITGGAFTLRSTAVLQVVLSGATQATQYTFINVAAGTNLGGVLDVSFGGTFGSAVQNAQTFTFLSSGSFPLGSFANAAFGGRIATSDGLGTFALNRSGSSILLSDFLYNVTAPQAVSWLTAASGAYTTGSNWSGGAVPNNLTAPAGVGYDVSIAAAGGPYTVSLASTVFVQSLNLNSANATLALNPGAILRLINGGTLQAGTLAFDNATLKGLGSGGLTALDVTGAALTFSSSGGNRLEGLQINGSFTIATAAGTARLLNGTQIQGTVNLTGNGAVLALETSQTYAGMTVNLGTASTPAHLSVEGNNSVVFDNSMVVRGSGTVGGARLLGGTQNLTNDGSITADVSGQTLAIVPTGNFLNRSTISASNGGVLQIGIGGASTVTNNGLIQATNSTVNLFADFTGSGVGTLNANNSTILLSGSFRSAGLAGINRTGGALQLMNGGQLDNTGNTFTLTPSLGVLRLSGGRLFGGTLDNTGGQSLAFSNVTSSRLDGVTVLGGLDLTTTSAFVRLQNGTTLSGTVNITGAAANLGYEQSVTVTGVTFNLGTGSALGNLTIEGNNTLTLDSTVTVRGAGSLGRSLLLANTSILLNQGTITADVSGQTLMITPNVFNNSGTVQVQGGGALTLGNGLATAVTNTGTFGANNGTLTLAGDFTGSGIGTLNALNSTITLSGNFLTPGLAGISRTGGVINLSGQLDNTGNTLTLIPARGLITLAGGRIVGGTIDNTGGQALDFNSSSGNRLEGVTFVGPLNLSSGNAGVRFLAGSSLPPVVNLTGTSNVFSINQSGSFDNLQVHLDGTNGSLSVDGAGTTVTFGPATLIRGAGLVGIQSFIGGGNNLTNEGTIVADRPGQVLDLRGTTFVNAPSGQILIQNGGILAMNTNVNSSGFIAVSNGTLNLSTTLNTPILGGGNGTINLNGTSANLNVSNGIVFRLPASGPANGGTLTLNSQLGLNITPAGIAGIDLNGDPDVTNTFDGGNGGTLVATASNGDINIDSPIDATTGQNQGSSVTGGNGGSVTLNAIASSTGTVNVRSRIQVSSDQTGRASSRGGNISISSARSGGTAINIANTAQLQALLSAAAPGPGGTINIVASGTGSNINVAGSARADRGSVIVRHNGNSGTVTAASTATLRGDIVKLGALGANGVLTIAGGTFDGDTTIRLYATGSNGQVQFTGNTTLQGTSVKQIAGQTVTINNGVQVNVLGAGGPAQVFTNVPNYSGSGGNGSTTGTFTGQGATTAPLSSAPGF